LQVETEGKRRTAPDEYKGMLLSLESRALDVGLEPLNLASFGIVVLLLAFLSVLVATLAVLLDPLLCEGPLFFVPKVGIQMSKAMQAG
jgi:hypothetical protein